MFFPGSRYEKAGTYTVRAANGSEVVVTRLPVRPVPPARGLHARLDGQRLDQLAALYLGDATAFWRLCDAAAAIAPDALAARSDIVVLGEGR